MPPPYCYDYPRPCVTLDLIAFAGSKRGVKVLLIRRDREPFAGRYALPGGFLEMEETLQDGAIRELREETGLVLPSPPEFLGVYGDPGRDPRGRTITIAYVALLPEPALVEAGDDAREAVWLDLAEAGAEPFAFDHDRILADARGWLSEAASDQRGLRLLSREFDRDEAEAIHRSILAPASGQIDQVRPWIQSLLAQGRIAETAPGSNRFVQRSDAD